MRISNGLEVSSKTEFAAIARNSNDALWKFAYRSKKCSLLKLILVKLLILIQLILNYNIPCILFMKSLEFPKIIITKHHVNSKMLKTIRNSHK